MELNNKQGRPARKRGAIADMPEIMQYFTSVMRGELWDAEDDGGGKVSGLSREPSAAASNVRTAAAKELARLITEQGNSESGAIRIIDDV